MDAPATMQSEAMRRSGAMTAPATMRAALSVRSQKRRAWEHWTTMASPQRSDAPSPADPAPSRRPVLRLRLVPWDVSCLVALLALLVLVALWTDWYSWLFGFLKDVCTGDTCPSVIGAAIAAALVGPFVSLLKGWYLSFWPVLAIVIVLLSSAAGSVLTEFSSTYWHGERSVGDTSE
jgi:hypothetical protein